MKQEGLVSAYIVTQYKLHMDKRNEAKVENIVN